MAWCPSEMAASWPQQALRAQAVASRTYAAWRRDHPIDVAYDLCDTALCQVYGGASAEHASSTKAARGTARQVLTFRGKPIFAEFSASNGGYTVSGGKRYLPARRDPYEGKLVGLLRLDATGSPPRRWRRSTTTTTST